MTLEGDLDRLRAIEVFRSLPPARLKLVALMGERLCFEPGEVLTDEGDNPDGVYFILDGEVEMARAGADGAARRFHFESGTIIGDVPLLAGRAYGARVTAKSEVEVLRLPKDLFFELMQSVPDFSTALSRELADRLYRLAEHVLHQTKAE